jgi:phthiodiolone/phenolphthiodiolone dimycocerosates ketoreductase
VAGDLRLGVPGSQLPAPDATRVTLRAEEQGFDSIWWADRLMGWLPEGPHALLDPVALIAASAVRTERIALGTAVVDPLRRHPAQLAQTALSLQQLSGGRLVLGVGCGEIAGTVPYGISYDKPVARLEEALHVMRLLWTSAEPISFDGRFFRLDGAICGLGAVVDPPPVWVAAHKPRMLGITGRSADGWMPTAHGAGPYADELAVIREAEGAAGRPAGSVVAGAFLWLVAADSGERARELFAAPGLRAIGLLLPGGSLQSSPLHEGPAAHLVPTDPAVSELVPKIDPDELASVIPHGTPEQIAAGIAAYVEAGAEHVVLCDMAAASGLDPGHGLKPFELYSAIRDALGATASSTR